MILDRSRKAHQSHTPASHTHTHKGPRQAFLRLSGVNLFLSWGPDKSPQGALIITSLSAPSPFPPNTPAPALMSGHYSAALQKGYFQKKLTKSKKSKQNFLVETNINLENNPQHYITVAAVLLDVGLD